MGFAYKIYDQEGQYFITCTVHQWVDVFTRRDYIDIFLESIRHCQANKGLEVHGWVPIAIGMTNHVHMIVSSSKDKLSDIRCARLRIEGIACPDFYRDHIGNSSVANPIPKAVICQTYIQAKGFKIV